LDELLISVNEAARRLGIGRSLCYELIASGQLPRVRAGRRTLVPVTALQDWVDRQLLAEVSAEVSAKSPRSAAISPVTKGLNIRRALHEVV
jgi:excisionase family DNA binding protein